MTDESRLPGEGVPSRLLLGAGLAVAAAIAVTVAATYVAGTESTSQVAGDATRYGASESVLTAATATHARLSEAIAVTAVLERGEVAERRLEAVRAAVDELLERGATLAGAVGEPSHPATERFVSTSRRALSYLGRGLLPPTQVMLDIDTDYSRVVEDVTDVRAAAAARIATARSQAGSLVTAARMFVLVVVPVLTLSAIYRILRTRQRHRELEVRLDSERKYAREKDRLIASVGHELQTPLTGVLGMSMALRDDLTAFDEEERTGMIAIIADQAQELAHRIDDLITVTRDDSKLLTSSTDRVDVRAAIDKVTYGWESRDGARLSVTGRGAVRGDSLHVEHVVRNLMTCAARSGGDLIEVWIHPGAMVLNVEIRDNGQAGDDGAGEEPTAGTGLGVGMVAARRLAELMGGSLERRHSEGVNTTILRLPLAPVTPEEDEPVIEPEEDDESVNASANGSGPVHRLAEPRPEATGRQQN